MGGALRSRFSLYLRVFTLDGRGRYEVVCTPSPRQRHVFLSRRHSFLAKTIKRDDDDDDDEKDRRGTRLPRYRFPFRPRDSADCVCEKVNADILAS